MQESNITTENIMSSTMSTTNTSLYTTMFLDERVALIPHELDLAATSTDGIRELLESKLREKHEGRCNANGYVRPGSIKMLGRSMGAAENGRFTGNMIFDCKISCEVLYPVAGAEMDVRVIKVNKMGAYAVYEEAVRVLLPRDLHIGNVEFDAIREGQTIRVTIDRSRFQTMDPYIMAVGRLVAEDMPSAVVGAQTTAPTNIRMELEETVGVEEQVDSAVDSAV